MRISDWSSDVCSSELVDDLMGGVILMFWSRAKRWAVAERLGTGNPKMHEWCEWIAGQIANRHASGSSAPAYLRDLHWRRSEERRVGKECVRKCRSRGSLYIEKKKYQTQYL